jgi:hypothetical protein
VNKIRLTLNLLGVITLALVCSSLAQAQATRTWVSGVGDDANPCSRTAPCKTFAGTYSKTAAGGEIDALDPGGYGGVTISKAMTIDGAGTQASILNAGANGVIVNAGVNDIVILRNLSINGVGTGLNGIRYLTGKALHVEHCAISGVTNNGIDVNFTAVAGQLHVKDTEIRNCAAAGIKLLSTTGQMEASIDHARVENCATGLDVNTHSRAMVSNSVFSHNSGAGMIAQAKDGDAELSVETTVISYNNVGIQSGGGNAGPVVRISSVTVMNNENGLLTFEGTIVSFGNNKVEGNTTNGSASSTVSLT